MKRSSLEATFALSKSTACVIHLLMMLIPLVYSMAAARIDWITAAAPNRLV